MQSQLIFRQLFEPQTSTYTYLLADADSKEAVIIDPVRETFDRDVGLLNELGLKLSYILDTHVHADHVTASGLLRKKTGAKIAINKAAGAEGADISLEDGQELKFGNYTIKALATPGHTNGCMSYYTEGRVFTGDTLLIRGTGRTDFQQGSPENMYESITQKLFKLPDETLVYPGHDYKGMTSSTVGEEKQFNPRVGGNRSKDDFVKIMTELNLPHPKRIDESVPANLKLGLNGGGRTFHPQVVDGVPEISSQDLKDHLGEVKVVDVRMPDEFTGELGHVPGAQLVTLGEDLERFLKAGDRSQEIAFVCRSGGRSRKATELSLELGYEKTVNMQGGMLNWNENKYPVKR